MPNKNEQNVLNALNDTWSAYLKILTTKISIDDDTNDFRQAIHECQRIIATKILARNYPLFWNS